jgi:hypothetical protein
VLIIGPVLVFVDKRSSGEYDRPTNICELSLTATSKLGRGGMF